MKPTIFRFLTPVRVLALTAVAVPCLSLLLSAADKAPSTDKSDEKPEATEKKPEATEKPAAPVPLPPRYRVMAAPGAGAGETGRKIFEAALNKADGEGYQFAGMNGDWVILERKPLAGEGTVRRRVVLPTTDPGK